MAERRRAGKVRFLGGESARLETLGRREREIWRRRDLKASTNDGHRGRMPPLDNDRTAKDFLVTWTHVGAGFLAALII
jgi:hypothetical protein